MNPDSDAARGFDVAVIGGGPGGSSVATALARRGRQEIGRAHV